MVHIELVTFVNSTDYLYTGFYVDIYIQEINTQTGEISPLVESTYINKEVMPSLETSTAMLLYVLRQERKGKD